MFQVLYYVLYTVNEMFLFWTTNMKSVMYYVLYAVYEVF